ncbi:sugar transferase [Pseudonocardia sp. McavD-2-B]|uniref:sugar transferase n=1 Tax=Pseudonocardia sp. McavD-2-B TaxID=2954499 RepID=UPI002096DE74|nr:sugar transferase [Pseudonocardia sp. McavD-2-B]MCO7193206.1 sugar transferase [Pseudonocardia sp. McavD-2-B]
MAQEAPLMRRMFDMLAAGAGLVVLSPVALVTAVAVRLTTGRRVVFRQQRIGLGGQPFQILKFRTMRDGHEDLPDRERCTRTGSFLRAVGLDEYPQLWNILRGDMSVIGPRPTLPEQVERYDAAQHRRHTVRPGLTGWAQVNGRNSISWPERIELDLFWIDHRSLALDLRILWLTVVRVLLPRDLYGDGGVNPDYPEARSGTA